MSVIAVVGAQWGDEGKGRVVDYLAADADLVIRYGGGNNAGHTVVNPHGHFKLHLIPSGIFSPRHAQPARQRRGHQPAGARDRARRARRGRHRLREPADQRSRAPGHAVPRPARPASRSGSAAPASSARPRAGSAPPTSTRSRGAGSAIVDLMEPDAVPRARWRPTLPRISRIVGGYPGGDPEMRRARSPRPPTRERIAEAYLAAGDAAERATSSTAGRWSTRRWSAGDRILLEGQLGTMRDIDWGTYPYVTSSSRRSPAARAWAPGCRPCAIDRVARRGEGVHHRRRRRARCRPS